MSSKIFPFKPRKVKAAKSPDPELERQFDAAKDLEFKRKAMRKEVRTIMADLYAEDLARRAKKLQKPCWCCGQLMDKYTQALVIQKLDKEAKQLGITRQEWERRLDEAVKKIP